MTDANQLTPERWKAICDEYEEENQELRQTIERLLNDPVYRQQAVAKEVRSSLRWHEEQVAAQAIEIEKLNRALAESVARCHELTKQVNTNT